MQNYNTIIGVIQMRQDNCPSRFIMERYRIGSGTVSLIINRYASSGLSLQQLQQILRNMHFKGPDFLELYFADKGIYDLMELFNLSLGFPGTHRRMGDPDPKPGKGKLQLSGDVLGTIVKVAGIKLSAAHDDRPEGIFHDAFFLGIIKPGCQNKTGVVIKRRGKVCPNHGTIFPIGSVGPYLISP